MPNLKRRATEAPEDTDLHPSKSPRLMVPMSEITSGLPMSTSTINGELPKPPSSFQLFSPLFRTTNKMPNLKRRATEAPEDTDLHPSKSPRLMGPMSEITNVLPKRTSIINGEIPKETMTMRQIRRHIEWLLNTAQTAWEYGEKQVIKARLAEVLEFAEIIPTRTFDELEEEWHGQCMMMVDEAYERIKEMQRTVKSKTPPTR
jgi:hypothetical protein